MEPLSMPHVSQRCPSLYIESMLPSFSHHTPLSLVRRKLKPESAIPQLSWLCMSAIPSTITGSSTLWSSPSTLYSFLEYLVLDDGGCLNALLPTDSIPSTSDHLFWDRSLESFEFLILIFISCRFSPIDSFGNDRNAKSRQLRNGWLRFQLPSNKSIRQMVIEDK